jgi:hypothetical protein
VAALHLGRDRKHRGTNQATEVLLFGRLAYVTQASRAAARQPRGRSTQPQGCAWAVLQAPGLRSAGRVAVGGPGHSRGQGVVRSRPCGMGAAAAVPAGEQGYCDLWRDHREVIGEILHRVKEIDPERRLMLTHRWPNYVVLIAVPSFQPPPRQLQ